MCIFSDVHRRQCITIMNVAMSVDVANSCAIGLCKLLLLTILDQIICRPGAMSAVLFLFGMCFALCFQCR